MATSKRSELDTSEVIRELPRACVDERAAVEWLENKRWGDCPSCPRCGGIDVYKMADAKTGERNRRFLWLCRDCKKQYTVRIGTVYEESLLPLHKWVHALWEASACKNGVSALELKRKLQINYRSALFLLHRIRYAMRPDPDAPKLSGVVEADGTFIGGRHSFGRPIPKKITVLAVVQRGGDVRTRVCAGERSVYIRRLLTKSVEPGSLFMTDDNLAYRSGVAALGPRRVVRHSHMEYSRPGRPGEPTIHTNTVEGFFARIDRMLMGTYHAVSRVHLHRYATHAAWLYNARRLNDGERILRLVRDTDGKRLMYREQRKKTA